MTEVWAGQFGILERDAVGFEVTNGADIIMWCVAKTSWRSKAEMVIWPQGIHPARTTYRLEELYGLVVHSNQQPTTPRHCGETPEFKWVVKNEQIKPEPPVSGYGYWSFESCGFSHVSLILTKPKREGLLEDEGVSLAFWSLVYLSLLTEECSVAQNLRLASNPNYCPGPRFAPAKQS